MILVGNQRGGGKDLALHLMKDENEHIELHPLRGFASDNLMGAFNETYAVSRATKCRQYLFSLSLNPPPNENVPTSVFENAIDRAEERLGLTGQPRAVVFHEKNGRRHAHAVWSRIDAENMKAVQLSFTHKKLNALARELYLEHGWTMPRGFISSRERDPKNFTLAEWQQAKRIGKDPRAIKADFQDSWAISDSRAAFAQALKARGYVLARGDRRSFVAVDVHGEVHAVAKRVGIKTKQVRERLGDADALPDVAQTRAQVAGDMIPALERMRQEEAAKERERRAAFERKRASQIEKQQTERKALIEAQQRRHAAEVQERQARFRKGLQGMWDRLRGEHARTQKQNEQEAYAAMLRDRAEKDRLIFRQLEDRRQMEAQRRQERERRTEQARELKHDLSAYGQMRAQRLEEFKAQRQESLQSAPPRHRERDGPERSR